MLVREFVSGLNRKGKIKLELHTDQEASHSEGLENCNVQWSGQVDYGSCSVAV